MRRALAALFLVISGPAAAGETEVTTVRSRAGFMPVPISEKWQFSNTGNLQLVRIAGPARGTRARPQVTRTKVTLSSKEYQQLKSALKAIPRHQGTGPCTVPDGPSITVQVVRARKSWEWSSDNGCNPSTALRAMKAAFEARSLLIRWTSSPMR